MSVFLFCGLLQSENIGSERVRYRRCDRRLFLELRVDRNIKFAYEDRVFGIRTESQFDLLTREDSMNWNVGTPTYLFVMKGKLLK